jgi:membrane-bound inhibitor of C-type lysozyme
MKKKTVIVLIVLLIISIFGVVAVGSQPKMQQKPEEIAPEITDYFIFSCPSGDEIKIRYDNKNNEAILLFREQRYILQRVISGSGARYANNDESIVFWEHHGEATLEVDGEIVAQSCLLEEISDHWKEFRVGDMRFKAPESLEEKYVSLQKWPPEIKILANKNYWPSGIEIENGELKCQTTLEESSVSKRFYQQNINGRIYCIRAESEGAAGSVFTDYTYYTIYKNNLVSINFVLRFTNCLHYSKPQSIECSAEREVFDIDNTINKIVDSIAFNL